MLETASYQPAPETADNKAEWLEELNAKKTRDEILKHISYLRMRFSPEEAEDIVQDTMFKATRAIKAGEFVGSSAVKLKTWLQRIAKNRALDLLRHKKFTNLMIPLPDTYELPSKEPTSEQNYLTAEMADKLNSGLNNLPPKLKAVMELMAEGLPQKEIAERLGLNLITVKSRQRYAYERLREWMK